MVWASVNNSEVRPAPTAVLAPEDKRDTLQGDIGLLQNTVVRAPLKSLPGVTSKEFRSYMWTLVKARVVSLYSRVYYHMYLEKNRWSRYLPVDVFKSQQLTSRAKHMYTLMHNYFNNGNAKALEELCLEPLARKLHRQMKERNIKCTWELKAWKSARIVSHNVSSLGESFPDTAYRQIIVRLESDQVVTVKPAKEPKSGQSEKLALPKAIKWVPEQARQKQQQSQQSQRLHKRQQQKQEQLQQEQNQEQQPESDNAAVAASDPLAATTVLEEQSGKTQRVVDYLVLQTRVIYGVQDADWKIWGFTQPSTPASIAVDQEYFGKQLDSQMAGTGLRGLG